MWSLPYLLSYQFSFKLSDFSLHLLHSSHPETFLCCHSWDFVFLFFWLGFLFQGFYSSSFLVYSLALRDHILQLFHLIEGMSGDFLMISCDTSASWALNWTAAAAAKSLQSCPTLCDPIDGSPSGCPILGFSRQEYWSGLPFPSPMHESGKWKWSWSVVSDS